MNTGRGASTHRCAVRKDRLCAVLATAMGVTTVEIEASIRAWIWRGEPDTFDILAIRLGIERHIIRDDFTDANQGDEACAGLIA